MSVTSTPVVAAAMSDTAVMVGRSLRHSVRNIDALMIGILLPVMTMLLITTVFGGGMESTGMDYVDYVLPGVMLLCAGYGASWTAISVTSDMTEGIVDRFRTMDVMPSSVLTGHVVASVLRNLVSTTLVVLTALAIGFRPSASPSQWLAAIALLALFIATFSWVSAVVGLVARTVESASSFGFFLLFMPYLSSAFVPVETLPGWLQPVAEHQPFTPITETLRGLLLGTPIEGQGWAAVAWCLGILTSALVAAALLWRRTKR